MTKDELKAFKLLVVRLEILNSRIKGCREETGRHELHEEAQMFVDEARKKLAKYEQQVHEQSPERNLVPNQTPTVD